MANRLKMAAVDSILRLHAQGWSQRRIAGELHVDRKTVSRYVQLAQPNPKSPNAPSGSDGSELEGAGPAPTISKGANAPLGSVADSLPPAVAEFLTRASGPGRRSGCEPYRELILAKLDQGLSAQRIHQDLVTDHGFTARYWSVRRFVQGLSGGRELPMRRLEVAPGAEAQIDFGTGARVLTSDHPSGGARKHRKTHVFRIVLSHSRKAYSEACFRQTTEDFLRAIENAFWEFGGVPQTLVIDNLKAAVAHSDWFDPELNPKLLSFCQYYGTVILPTRPRTPRHKGKIERGIGYVKNNGLKGRTFESLEAQNQHLAHWEATVADTRIHGTTKRQVGKLYEEAERAALLPLPATRFAFFHEAKRIVNRDGHIEVAKAYYSTPPEYLGRTVWARWDGKLVRVFNHRFEQIAVHLCSAPGRFSTLGEHLVPEKISGIERGATWLLTKAQGIGPHAHAWAAAMLKTRGIEGLRTLQGLLSLSKRHACEALDRACETALTYDAFRLKTLRRLLKHRGAEQQPLPFLDEHPIIRSLSDYGSWVRNALAVSPAAGEIEGRDHQAPRSLPPNP